MPPFAHGNFSGKRLVVFGCGYVGGAVAREARERGMRVTALTRNAAKAIPLREAGIEVECRLEFGPPREVIPRIANEDGFSLLVIGRRGPGELSDVLFGSVANHVLHHVRCPVLLI